jgi:hypothetical protein
LENYSIELFYRLKPQPGSLGVALVGGGSLCHANSQRASHDPARTAGITHLEQEYDPFLTHLGSKKGQKKVKDL